MADGGFVLYTSAMHDVVLGVSWDHFKQRYIIQLNLCICSLVPVATVPAPCSYTQARYTLFQVAIVHVAVVTNVCMCKSWLVLWEPERELQHNISVGIIIWKKRCVHMCYVHVHVCSVPY